jgi:cytochrome P450
MLAGHETTSNTIGWILYELAQQPEVQKQLRQEIRNMREGVRARGQTEVTMRDLDAMPYLLAVVKVCQSQCFIQCISRTHWFSKEGLRMYPILPESMRTAGQNDVLPLSDPIVLDTGKVLHELPIPKGINIVTSIYGYNRLVCLGHYFLPRDAERGLPQAR